MKKLLPFVARLVAVVVLVVLPLFGIVVPAVVALGVVLTPDVALAQSADRYEKYRQFERRVCVHPAHVPKSYVKWAMFPNGTLSTYKEGEFYEFLPAGALIYIYDPRAPWCKSGKPEPQAGATEPPGVQPGTPLAPPSDGGKGDKEGRKQSTSDAKKKVAEGAAKAAQEAKAQAEKEVQSRKKKARKAAEEAEERKREEAEKKNEADEAARKARTEREAEEQYRKRNSPEARWDRGEAILPPASRHRLAAGTEYQLPKACEPVEGNNMAPIRSLGADCTQGMLDGQRSGGEEVALPSTCKPPPEGDVAPMRSLGEECTKGEPATRPTNEGEEPKEAKAENDPSTLEGLARELAYLAAMTSGQFNEETAKNGDPFGIIGGKNIGGSANPYTQIAAAVGIILANAAPSPEQFRKTLLEKLASRQQVVLTTTSEAMEAAAEQLVKTFGGKRMAAALEQAGMIAPYRLMRKFTDGLGGLYQAHHILEVAQFKRFFSELSSDLGPAVILSAAKHAEITAALRAETAAVRSPEALLAAYRRAYKDYPHWVEAMKSYFTK